MKVIKRNGTVEEVNFEKIRKRLKDLSKGLNVEVDLISQKAIERLSDNINTTAIDEHLATITANHAVHPHYSILAGRICISSLHKQTAIDKLIDSEKEHLAKMMKYHNYGTDNKFIQKLKNSLFEDPKREQLLADYESGRKLTDDEISFLTHAPRFFYYVKVMHEQGILSDELLNVTIKYRELIENKIDYSRDFMFDYFGFKTLEKAYLLKHFSEKTLQVDILDSHGNPTGGKRTTVKTIGKIIELPQDLFMRVSLGIHHDNIEKALEMYDLMSQGFYTHATPTLFNSGTKRAQMSSCFLLANNKDSIEGIFHTFEEEALISKNSGGIGVWYHNIRAAGSHIKGTNGTSNGILPFLKIKNEIAKGIDQGGKRPGSIAVYLEPWHADVREFIQLRRNNGSEDQRARGLFLALWVPDLFYKRIEQGGQWSLFDPSTAPGLFNVVGKEFEELYTRYEQEGRAVAILEAREFMKDIFEIQVETGMPYMLNKDAANLKSNQKNLGIIKSSNLCAEILEYSDDKESAVCNLSSICLPKFVKEDKTFDYQLLYKVVRKATYNLNAVIDKNYYVNDKTKLSNMRHRPIGMGVQGLADVFFKMRLPFTSDEALEINKRIFETIYFAALSESVEIAKRDGHYTSMKENGGSPISQGILQCDMWGVQPSTKWNWKGLREEIAQHGVRNSLLIALMPTASSSQIFGNTESFEPLTENLYKRKTSAGEFTVVNKHLISHLEELGLWGRDILESMIRNDGSIQKVTGIPAEVREIYKTVWELSLKKQIDMAADRGAFICQTQSFNIHMGSPSMERMKDVYMYAWKKGLKTASYYFRTQAATTNQKVTVDREVVPPKVAVSQAVSMPENSSVNVKSDDDDCLVCGS